MVGGEIKVVMTLDDGDFSVKTVKNGNVINEMKRSLDQTALSTKKLESHFTSLGKEFQSTVFTLSLVRFALSDIHDIFIALPSSVLKTAGEIERMSKLMEGMSQATDEYGRKAEAASNIKFIFNMAQNAPFEVKALTDAFVKMKSAGIDPTLIGMSSLSESVAKFGGTSETMHRASIAIQQMAGKGVISMEELRQQLGEAVPNAINLMARGAGKSISEFADLVKQGTVEAKDSLNNMFLAMDFENRGSAAGMMDTWTGMLSLLKTKFELFKNDIANSDFFGSAKNQVQDLISSFDSRSAQRLAFDIGKGLAEAVSVLRSIIDLVVEYGGVIKMAGEAFALYFGARAVGAILDSFKSAFSAKMGMYNSEVEAIVKRRNAEAAAIAEVAILDKKASAEKMARAAEMTQMAGKLYAEQAAQARQVAVLEAKAPGWSQNKIAHLNEQIAKTRELIQQLQSEAVAERQSAMTQAASAEAHARVAEAIRLRTMASREDIAMVEASTLATRANAASLAMASGSAVKAATSIDLMTKATAASKVVFNAFGGWVGIAIGVLVTLGDKLYEYMNRWKEFQEIVEKTQRGMASKDDRDTAEKRLNELNSAIAEKKRELDGIKPGQEMQVDIGPGGVVLGTVNMKKKLQDELDDLLARKNIAAKTFTDASLQVDKEEQNRYLTEFQRDIEKGAQLELNKYKKSVVDLETKKNEELNKAKANNPNFTTVDEKAINDKYQAQITAETKGFYQWQLAYAKTQRDKLSVMVDAEKNTKRQEILKQELSWLEEEYVKHSKNLADLSEKFGTLKTANKPGNQKPEAPLIRMVEDTKAAVAQAKLKLEATANDARGMVQLRNEAMMSVLGDMASGRLDQSLGKDPNNSQSGVKRDYVGGIEERKKYTQMFVEYLNSGKSDIDEFVNSLEGMTDAQRRNVVQLVESRAALQELPQFQKALTDAQMKGAQSELALIEAKDRYMLQNASIQDTAFLKEEKHYAALEQKYKALTEAFKPYLEAKAQDLGNLALLSVNNDGIASQEALKKTTIDYNAMWMSNADKRAAALKEEIRLIDLKAEDEIAHINKVLAMESVSAEKRKELEAGIETAKKNQLEKTQVAQMRTAISGETQLQKLSQEWNDTTEQMNKATGRWANTIVDAVVAMTVTGKMKWKDMALAMVTDMYKIMIQKLIAAPLVGFLESVGNTMSKALGGAIMGAPSKVAGDAAGAAAGGAGAAGAAGAASTAPMTALSTAATSAAAAINAMTAALTGNTATTQANTVATASDASAKQLSTVATTTDTAVREATTVATLADTAVTQTDTAIAANFGATMASAMIQVEGAKVASMFANGGIMTSSGPLPLNMYANGGVANSPQVAVFGEGKMPEAYVPLPDGRSIPVTMSGNSVTDKQSGSNISISIQVNNDGQSTTQKNSDSDESASWAQVATKVKAVVMEEMVKQKRPGGVLYN